MRWLDDDYVGFQIFIVVVVAVLTFSALLGAVDSKQRNEHVWRKCNHVATEDYVVCRDKALLRWRFRGTP